jgi:hypothetical protein
MYPSGIWRGFWEQSRHGRQPMHDFYLNFRHNRIDGHGQDIIGRFVFRGECDLNTGRIHMVKQYIGKHQVLYVGGPDGEGSIVGTWSIPTSFEPLDPDASDPALARALRDIADTLSFLSSGPFLLQPALDRATGEEPIFEITK